MSDRPLVSVRNLAKRYGGVVALADMNLDGQARHASTRWSARTAPASRR